jgi:hypothetical protein
VAAGPDRIRPRVVRARLFFFVFSMPLYRTLVSQTRLAPLIKSTSGNSEASIHNCPPTQRRNENQRSGSLPAEAQIPALQRFRFAERHLPHFPMIYRV